MPKTYFGGSTIIKQSQKKYNDKIKYKNFSINAYLIFKQTDAEFKMNIKEFKKVLSKWKKDKESIEEFLLKKNIFFLQKKEEFVPEVKLIRNKD